MKYLENFKNIRIKGCALQIEIKKLVLMQGRNWVKLMKIQISGEFERIGWN